MTAFLEPCLLPVLSHCGDLRGLLFVAPANHLCQQGILQLHFQFKKVSGYSCCPCSRCLLGTDIHPPDLLPKVSGTMSSRCTSTRQRSWVCDSSSGLYFPPDYRLTVDRGDKTMSCTFYYLGVMPVLCVIGRRYAAAAGPTPSSFFGRPEHEHTLILSCLSTTSPAMNRIDLKARGVLLQTQSIAIILLMCLSRLSVTLNDLCLAKSG